MSVSKWAYTPEKCDGQPCVGDCDLCSKAFLTDTYRRAAQSIDEINDILQGKLCLSDMREVMRCEAEILSAISEGDADAG